MDRLRSYTNFSLAFSAVGDSETDTVHADLADLATLSNLSFAVKLTNTGSRAGKETVMAYWTPPDSVDAELKQQLFAFSGAFLQPGESTVLTFSLSEPAAIATVNEAGDRLFHPGDYTVRFSRGHSAELSKTVSVSGATTVLSTFPSRWVEGHEISVDACVEGTTDVVPHTEAFLVEYKQFSWAGGEIKHRASGLCITPDSGSAFVHLRNCSSASKWSYDATAKTFKTASGGCLVTSATTTTELRVNVTVGTGAACASPSAHWSYDAATGFIRSGIASAGPPPTTADPWRWGASPLCLAARSEGAFNTAS